MKHFRKPFSKGSSFKIQIWHKSRKYIAILGISLTLAHPPHLTISWIPWVGKPTQTWPGSLHSLLYLACPSQKKQPMKGWRYIQHKKVRTEFGLLTILALTRPPSWNKAVMHIGADIACPRAIINRKNWAPGLLRFKTIEHTSAGAKLLREALHAKRRNYGIRTSQHLAWQYSEKQHDLLMPGNTLNPILQKNLVLWLHWLEWFVSVTLRISQRISQLPLCRSLPA